LSEISISAIERIIRKGSGLRVSDSASKELSVYLDELGVRISQKASVLAKHAGRKTVTDEDIKLAIKQN